MRPYTVLVPLLLLSSSSYSPQSRAPPIIVLPSGPEEVNTTLVLNGGSVPHSVLSGNIVSDKRSGEGVCFAYEQYVFNLKTNRFLEIYAAGFIDGIKDNDSATPLIAGGTCTKIE